MGETNKELAFPFPVDSLSWPGLRAVCAGLCSELGRRARRAGLRAVLPLIEGLQGTKQERFQMLMVASVPPGLGHLGKGSRLGHCPMEAAYTTPCVNLFTCLGSWRWAFTQASFSLPLPLLTGLPPFILQQQPAASGIPVWCPAAGECRGESRGAGEGLGAP